MYDARNISGMVRRINSKGIDRVKKKRILRDFKVLIEKLSVKDVLRKVIFLKMYTFYNFFIFDHTFKIVIVSL